MEVEHYLCGIRSQDCFREHAACPFSLWEALGRATKRLGLVPMGYCTVTQVLTLS